MSNHIFHPESLDAHSKLLRGYLSEISTEGLSIRLELAMNEALTPELRNAIADAVVELATLIDEIRFSGSLAALFIRDYEKQAPTEPDSPEIGELREIGWPIAAMALLSPYFAPLPAPAKLFSEPHTSMAGNRILSMWFAGQMIDSAMFRLVAAMDRLAIILWCSGAIPLPKVRGRTQYPAFRPPEMATLSETYSGADFDKLVELTHHELFELLLRVRHGFTHSTRTPSELHGHYRIAYEVTGPGEIGRIAQAVDSGTHMAILLASYNEILRVAVAAVRNLLKPA